MEEYTNVAANTTEGTATPQIEQTTPMETTKTEVTAEPTEKVETTEPVKQDVTQTQAFAQRLKEETTKAKQIAKDEFIASQGFTWNNKPITTEAEYNQALMEREYQERGIDPNILNEAIENNPILKQAQDVIKQNEQLQKENSEYMDFFRAYPDVNVNEISQEVLEAYKNGTPLKLAYAAYQENASLKAKLAEYEKGQKTQEINNKNALTSTGSVANGGNPPIDFITKDVFEANKKDQNWLSKNYDLLKNSMNKWR